MDITFLIDTNITIQFEEAGLDGIIKKPFAKLHSKIIEHKIPTYIHPISVEDIENDTDLARKKETLSRIEKYPFLDSPPKPIGNVLEELFGGMANSNDVVDSTILYALHKSCAAYLITEDNGLHKRARAAGLSDRVLSVSEALDLLARTFDPTSIQLPAIKDEFCYNIDINDPLFNTLKEDYADFPAWFEKCCREHRKAWIIKEETQLAAICLYKLDESQEISGIEMQSMKLCTFKVSDDFRGHKFGELLLKMAFNYASANGIKSIWLTTKTKQTLLIQFLKDFGFNVHSELKGEDMVFYKYMFVPVGLPEMKPLNFHIKYSPHYLDSEVVSKFVIPIRPQYHDLLFPEISPQMSLGTGIPGNTIKKIYISQSKIRALPKGSIITFYRSSPDQHITTIGIVDQCQRLSNLNAIAAAIGKRSVYSFKEVEEMVTESGEILIIKFRLINHIENPISIDRLVESGVFNKHPPQSIKNLDHEFYKRLKDMYG